MISMVVIDDANVRLILVQVFSMATISCWNTSPNSLSWPFTHFSPTQLYLCGPERVLLYQSCLLGVCVLTTMV